MGNLNNEVPKETIENETNETTVINDENSNDIRIEDENLDFDFFPPTSFDEKSDLNNKKPKGLHAPKVSKTAKNDALCIIAKALKNRARFIAHVSLGILAIAGIIISSVLLGSLIVLTKLFICIAGAILGLVIYSIILSLVYPRESIIFDQLIKLSRIQFNELWENSIDSADELGGSSHREEVKDFIDYLFIKADLAKSAWQNYDY